MKLCTAMFSIALLSSVPAIAQHTATQPVLSATPPPAAEQQAPAAAASSPVQPSPAATSQGAPSQAAQAKSSASVGPDYILAPEDSIEITVWKEPALSGTLPVRPDGMISLALLGDLPAAGFTPMRLSSDIATRLKKYVNDPRVTVTVLGVHVDKVFLMGEVGRVGPVPLTPQMTPLQAIASAGGLTLYANAKHIYILRKQQGQQRRIPYNYKKALKSGDEQGISLIAGDTIVVP